MAKDPDFEQSSMDPDDIIDNIIREAKGGFEKLTPGNYAAVMDGVRPWQSEKGIFMRFDMLVWTEDNPIFKHAIFTHISHPDGTAHEWGPSFYKQHMAALGYEKENCGKEAREEIERDKPAIAIQISASKQNPDFVNTKIKSLLADDNEEIQEIREAMEKNPY